MCLRLLVSDLDSSPFDSVAVLECVLVGKLVHVNRLRVGVRDSVTFMDSLALCVHASETLSSSDIERNFFVEVRELLRGHDWVSVCDIVAVLSDEIDLEAVPLGD